MVASSSKGANASWKPTLAEQGIDSDAVIHWNIEVAELIEMAVKSNMGFYTKHGVLVTETGTRTGRSPNDRFIVEAEGSKENVNWGKVNVSTSLEVFENLKEKVLEYL